jgi:hypothetical protein
MDRFNIAPLNLASTPGLWKPDTTVQSPTTPNDIFQLQSKIGALLYLGLHTRPDIVFNLNKVARSIANPEASDYAAMERILHYLNATRATGVVLNGETIDTINSYSDADWAGDKATRRSTSGTITFLALHTYAGEVKVRNAYLCLQWSQN